MSSVILETARLRLREISDADANFMLELLNEPAFHQNIGDRGVRTVADASNYICERITSAYERYGFGMWLIELQGSGELVGTCGLIKRDVLEDVDLGFSFLERFWSRGYAIESAKAVIDYAWTVAKLSRVVAIVAPHNAPSIRLLQKLGFVCEQRIRLTSSDPELMLFAKTAPSPGAQKTSSDGDGLT
jgi:[ribosomal protein S5]-alanine N-acetyltransferase